MAEEGVEGIGASHLRSCTRRQVDAWLDEHLRTQLARRWSASFSVPGGSRPLFGCRLQDGREVARDGAPPRRDLAHLGAAECELSYHLRYHGYPAAATARTTE